ncbi:16398_t:CDS:2, partial [Dentiscutata erythropus]
MKLPFVFLELLQFTRATGNRILRDASQIDAIIVRDLTPKEAIDLLKSNQPESEDELEKIVKRICCHFSYINKLALTNKETDIYGLILNFEEEALNKQEYASYPKWIKMIDHDNIIIINEHQNIKADSKIPLNIFEEIVNQDGFDKLLDDVSER